MKARTTIQIHKDVKEELNKLKENVRETYEDVISKLILIFKQIKNAEKLDLIEGYKEMAKDSLKIAKEWEVTERELK